jgi:modulator of FtsH protease
MIPPAKNLRHSAKARRSRHKVLRNTYWLLALSMIPTVLGAFIGVQTAPADGAAASWLLCSWRSPSASSSRSRKTKNRRGVPVLLGFTFFMGLMLTPLLRAPSASPTAAS